MSAPEQSPRWVADHLAEQALPCLRCGAATRHRALLLVANRVRLSQPRCGGRTHTHRPRHRDEQDQDEPAAGPTDEDGPVRAD